MIRSSIASRAALLILFTLFGCETATEPSSVSVETVESTVAMRSIAPGVSEGDYGDQRVVYVNGQQGADWLLAQTSQEYNSLFARYTQTHDASVLARMGHLQNTLQATSDNAAGPFVMTYAAVEGGDLAISCSGGGGTCTCNNNCTCSASGGGCSCTCPVQ